MVYGLNPGILEPPTVRHFVQKFTVQARTSAGSTELDEFTSDLYKFHGVRASRGDVASTRVRFSNVAVETFDLWTY